ncbi:MAG: VOC family protein [Hyphomicrobiales bacterium]
MSEITMTTPGNAGWIGHSGPDSAAAKKFYGEILGWTIADLPMQDGSAYSGIMIGDQPIGGFSPMPEDTGAWTIFVTVEDVDACVERVKKAGGSVITAPMDMPGVGRMSTIADPQGARIAVITYESMKG